MPPGEEMGFELIRQVQLKESRSQAPTKVPADFFEQLTVHIDRLRALAREEMSRDPMSARATLVQNELRSTTQAARDIVMLRLRKLANRAVDALEGGKVDLQNLTPGERELYGELATFVARGRDGLLPSERPARGGPAQRAAPSSQPAEGADAESVPSIAASPPRGAETATLAATTATTTAKPALAPAPVAITVPAPAHGKAHGPAPGPDAARPREPTAGTAQPAPADLVVHVLKDVPQFAGEEGSSYALRAGDVVNLPRRLAEVLVQRGVAEAIDVASRARP
jgi:DNA replication initiation complex subunit (GINS family)